MRAKERPTGAQRRAPQEKTDDLQCSMAAPPHSGLWCSVQVGAPPTLLPGALVDDSEVGTFFVHLQVVQGRRAEHSGRGWLQAKHSLLGMLVTVMARLLLQMTSL